MMLTSFVFLKCFFNHIIITKTPKFIWRFLHMFCVSTEFVSRQSSFPLVIMPIVFQHFCAYSEGILFFCNAYIRYLCHIVRVYNHIQAASKLQSGCDYSMFKVIKQWIPGWYKFTLFGHSSTFFSGCSGFPPSTKTNTPNSNLTWKQ